MTGEAEVDAHLRVATDALVQRIRARGYELAPPAAVGAAMQRGVTDPNGLRSAVGAELAVRTKVTYRDRFHAVIHVTVVSALGERGQDVTATPAEIDTAVPAAVDTLLPAPGTAVAPGAPPVAAVPVPATQPGADRVVLKDGSVVEGRVIYQAPGSYVIVQGPDGRQRTIPWDRVHEVYAHAPAQPMPGGPTPAGTGLSQLGAPPSGPRLGGQATWDKRGGSIFAFDLQAQVSGILQTIQTTVDKTFTSGQQMTFTGESSAGGGGGGAGLHFGYLYLAAPDVEKSTTWSGFRMGTGFDFAMIAYGHRTDAHIQAGLRDSGGNELIRGYADGGDTKWGSTRVIMIPMSIGGQFGFGKFWGESRWNGVMVGIDYRPTYFHSKPSDFKSATDGFNPAGFQLTLDIGSLEAANKSEANFRMSVFLLPPVGNRPTFLTLGFGAAWY